MSYRLCLEPALAISPPKETLHLPRSPDLDSGWNWRLEAPLLLLLLLRVEGGWCFVLSACVYVAKIFPTSDAQLEKEESPSFFQLHGLPISLAQNYYVLSPIDLCFLQGKENPIPTYLDSLTLMDSSMGKSQTRLGSVDFQKSRWFGIIQSPG